ncbi:cytoplasmic tRNA 2-thiolation protein [Chloropicon primus]|uniref:Multifunctional fusion protein n=1 Tax=Chloropicon primus TaxID=1764295 RepID=A0A5B8MJC5_9CHLO|nr:cytoplasmic tRNA 2-thiolation protein [Chloropicon primus]UPQ99930.1 cytoplasmic tRNA 2-thiolation protein [Chloropicon primus]|eukprot:QDZ20718.1 cytoplasmic tRNA 2-thiolation protein [Chloropicon primus]
MVLELWRDWCDGSDEESDSTGLEEVDEAEYSYMAEFEGGGGGACGRACDCDGGGGGVGGVDEDEDGRPSRRQFSTPPCLKCGNAPAQFIARQREPLCRTCAEDSISNKVKTTIVRPGQKGAFLLGADDTLAIACSGGFNSMGLIEIIRDLADLESQRRRPRFGRGMKVIHVVTESEEDSRIRRSLAAIDASIEYVAVPLSLVESSDENLAHFLASGSLQPGSSSATSLAPSSSSKASKHLLKKLLVKLLCLRVAKALGCTKLAFGYNATYFAMHSLASILRGSGFALPAELQYTDSRSASWGFPDIIHPLRDCVSKELLLLCYLRNIDFVASESDIVGDRTDVKSLCKDFVFSAQDRLPSTVLTVTKTVSKLDYGGIREEDVKVLDSGGRIKQEKMCRLCLSPMCTSSKAFALSQQQQRQRAATGDHEELEESFCYSCCSLFGKNNENLKLWPVGNERASVGEYLTANSSGGVTDVIEEIRLVPLEEGRSVQVDPPASLARARHGMTCAYCRTNRAMLKRPKTKENVCKECFYEAFEEEIHQTIMKEKLFNRGDRVAIGASGGKDSTVLIHVLKTLNERYDYGLELFLLSVDEGIRGYRDDSLETVARNEQQYGIPLEVVSYKDLYGYSMDDIVAKVGLKNNCTFCGVFRRQALDRGAVLLNANKIVTGHNADDIAETVFLNVLRGDFPRLTRCTNSITGEDSALPRCKPFKYTYEKEIVMYAFHKKLDYFATECTYSPQAYRGVAREFIKDVEIIEPVCILNTIISGDEMKLGANSSSGRPLQVQGECAKCGYMTSQRICKACVLLEGLDKGDARYGVSRQACRPLR